MSKGSQIVQLRVGDELLEQIRGAMERANLRTTVAPYTLSEWIRKAVCEKIAHLERGRREETQLVTQNQEALYRTDEKLEKALDNT